MTADAMPADVLYLAALKAAAAEAMQKAAQLPTRLLQEQLTRIGDIR